MILTQKQEAIKGTCSKFMIPTKPLENIFFTYDASYLEKSYMAMTLLMIYVHI